MANIKIKDADGAIKYMSATGEGTALSPYAPVNEDWYQKVAEGKIAGHTEINKYGENPDIDTGTDPEDIWDLGGIYTFSESADIDSISSSENSDTQEIRIVGQDINNVEVVQTVTLLGQTKVPLTTPLYRVYRMSNEGNTDIAGIVYCYVDTPISSGVPTDITKARAAINDGNNQTLMMIYTVPAGHTLYYKQGYIAMSKNTDASATFSLRTRTQGGVFKVKRKIALNSGASSYWLANYVPPRVIPEKTDVIFRCDNVSASGIGVTGGFTGILVEN